MKDGLHQVLILREKEQIGKQRASGVGRGDWIDAILGPLGQQVERGDGSGDVLTELG
jgi:hypothetical protein